MENDENEEQPDSYQLARRDRPDPCRLPAYVLLGKKLIHKRKCEGENYGERTLNISPDSIYTGALGAALFSRRESERGEKDGGGESA